MRIIILISRRRRQQNGRLFAVQKKKKRPWHFTAALPAPSRRQTKRHVGVIPEGGPPGKKPETLLVGYTF